MGEIPEGCPGPDEIVPVVNRFRKNSKSSEVEVLGKGGFGSVIRYKDWVVKLMEIPSDGHRAIFDFETVTLSELSAIEELRDFIPRYCWSGISDKGEIGIIIQHYEPVMTLAQIVNTRGHLPAKPAYEYIKNLIRGYELLHKAGYIHRDIKPGNILVRTGGPKQFIPILIDFGLACKAPCVDFHLKGTPAYVPMNWIHPEAKGRFQRENMFVVHGPGGYKNLAFERRIPSNTTLRKKIKTQPYAMNPEYSEASDGYALFITLSQMFDKVDWTGHTDLRDEIQDKMQRLRDRTVFELAAQYARNTAGNQPRRLKALEALNKKRGAILENRSGENANARNLLNFAAPKEGTRKRGRANNRPERQSRQRQGDAPHA
jgi:serine/threonine protein kinase